MKAIHLKKFGLENLQLVEAKTPDPGPDEVLIRVDAVSLNYIDLAVTKGIYNSALALPRIPVSDGAGVVETVGSAVTRFKKGDRVMVHYYQKWLAGKRTVAMAQSQAGQATQGALAEYAVFPEYGLVRIPDSLTTVEASTLPIAALTAWTGLIEQGQVTAGHTVLTQGTGGVSIFALQFAKALGARVIATSGSDAKLEKLKALGADDVINYKTNPAWDEEVLRLTGGEGADATLDVGGAETIGKSLRSLRMHGFVGLVGFITGATLPIDFFRMVNACLRVQGLSVGSRESLENMVRAVDGVKLKPVIDTIYPIEKTQEAFRHMESGSFVGKIVVKI
ncbi:zinc-dependent alcohol dehydrogenase family protein [Chryseolinea soli]|uniref:NAD(P)-dependent alcohol dehydrogenase n=1 Tax=Chryseolinea soli TaxID=2321403 RepID=A0A385SM43_9BACT|nr:NAD(P)-dependent alcohol dehydrogenase [Chryseolinea soli]AYB30078.1 NAD(P)-dependent alcohol dehydrogenase [Chryseolinea soli]